MIIFTNESDQDNRGRVIVLQQDSGKPDEGGGFASGSILSVDDWDGFTEMKSIFTRVQIAENCNYQFLHTLGERIYLYVFGDRIGMLNLSGLSFYDICNDDPEIGMSKIAKFYHRQRLTARPDPLKVTIDPSTVFECYLAGMRGDVVNTAQRLFQFSLTLALLPPESESYG